MLVAICICVFIEVIIILFPIAPYMCKRRTIVNIAGENQPRSTCRALIIKIEEYLYNKILLAGLEQEINISKIMMTEYILALGGVILGLLMYCPIYGVRGVFIGMVFSALFCCYPLIRLERKITERKAEIVRELPNALTNIAVITDGGLNLQQALIEVADLNKGEIGLIFKKVMLKVDMGKSFIEALEEIPELPYIEELNRVVSCVVQTLRKGSMGITKVLRKQAYQCWLDQKNKLKEIGQKTSFKLFIPVYLLVFPAVGMLMIAPAVINMVEAFTQ